MQHFIDFERRPEGFKALTKEPKFNPAHHLALEKPAEILTLTDFGYTPDDIAQCPCDFAVTSVFRVLSDEGVACLYEVCKQLETHATGNPRIERCVRGGVYRSKFLRDLCLSPDMTAFLSAVCGLKLLPHTIPHQLGHLNYAPAAVGNNVDKWHVDTLRFDYVMFVTDPKQNSGGAFQYFRGSKHEVAALKKEGKPLPPEKIISPDMPGAGYAVLQQGNMVAHQARGLTRPGERITMVNGYIPENPAYPDYTRYDQLVFADPPAVVTAEYSRHAAIQAKRLLEEEIESPTFSTEREPYAARLETVARTLQDAARQIRSAKNVQMEHFGD